MLRIIGKVLLTILIGLVGLIVLGLLFLGATSIFVKNGKVQTNSSRFYRTVLYTAVWIAVVFGMLTVKVTGGEKIDRLVKQGRRFLLVGNHISNFDPIVTWFAFRKAKLAFISKPANFKIPFFGKIARKCLCLPIDREDPRKALPTIRQAAEYIKADEVSFGAYPEGTRNKTPERGLLPFRNGVFKIAQWAGNVPIAVVAVQGTEQVCRNWPLRRTVVSLDVLRVLEPEEIAGKKTAEIGETVRKELSDAIYGEKAQSAE